MFRVACHLGLTGGIGSGKSTVAALLAERGARVIDADAISRSTTAAGGSAMDAIAVAFGASMLTADGALDRDQMRNLVYTDPSAKARLERIVHPLVGQAIAQQAMQAELAGMRCIVFDIPLLVESAHWRQKLDRVVVIDCREETQIARVTARNALSPAAVQSIIAAQATRPVRLAAADLVVYNDGIALDQLRLQVQEIGTQFGL